MSQEADYGALIRTSPTQRRQPCHQSFTRSSRHHLDQCVQP